MSDLIENNYIPTKTYRQFLDIKHEVYDELMKRIKEQEKKQTLDKFIGTNKRQQCIHRLRKARDLLKQILKKYNFPFEDFRYHSYIDLNWDRMIMNEMQELKELSELIEGGQG
jgi:hypothetical protein